MHATQRAPCSSGNVRWAGQTDGTMWRITGCTEMPAPGDYQAFRYEIESEMGVAQPVEIRLIGTMLACRDDTLPAQVAEAKLSSGRSMLEALLPWDRVPRLIVITTDWITLFHANGYFSRVGCRLPEEPVRRFQALAERARIRLSYGQGVEEVYEFKGDARWSLQSFQGQNLRREEPRMLSDVVRKLSGEQAQAALDLDPEGSSQLARRQLNEGEARILRSLIEESPYNTVDQIYAELTKGPHVAYEVVEDNLDLLLARGYVEEFQPGHWQATPSALHIRRRLLGLEPAAA
jgi:hypothetical protein